MEMAKRHYNYNLQVWIVGGKVANCGHPPEMRARGWCCNGARFAGMSEDAVELMQGRE